MSTDWHTPSRSRYVRGCRCDGCRACNTAWLRDYHGRVVEHVAPGRLLAVTCWCETHWRLIPAAEVAAGRTWSCGGERCLPTV